MLALNVQHLKKTYRNGTMALKGISFQVEEGEFFALLGQNGAGKSTTIGIISSLINKTAGSIHIFNHDLNIQTAAAKALVGVVPQEVNFNAFEKVSDILINQAGYYGVPRSIAHARMRYFLNEMGLSAMQDQPAVRLSGGMKRRLLIARAMMNAPKLLILDEPTAGVDIELRYLLWQFLKKINQEGTTIILTTHYLEEAEHLCRQVAIIDHGEVIENSRMKDLINRLQTETFILDLQKPIAHAPSLSGFPCQWIDDTALEVTLGRHQSINQLIEQLNAERITVISMRNKANRLEQLFVKLINENKQ